MSKQRLIVMCVDALFTTDLADVCRMEGFREILEDAAVYENIECIYPTLTDRKSTRLNSSHITRSRMPSSA